MIGYDLWQDRFGGSREILGKTVRANGVTRTVIGVRPEGVGVEVKAFTERFLGPEIYGLLYTMLGAALGVRLLRTYGFRGGGCS